MTSDEPKEVGESFEFDFKRDIFSALFCVAFSFFGSGPPSTDSATFKVVAHEEHMNTDEVHVFGLGKGQGFTDKTG